MGDGEIQQLIMDELAEYSHIDPADVEVEVSGGHVRLVGRVDTEHDFQTIEHVLTDVLGVSALSNELLVDGLRRGEQPEAADEARAARLAGRPGEGAMRTTDTAEHLLRNTTGEQQGTEDLGEAIERGFSYNPPTRPIQEGSLSRRIIEGTASRPQLQPDRPRSPSSFPETRLRRRLGAGRAAAGGVPPGGAAAGAGVHDIDRGHGPVRRVAPRLRGGGAALPGARRGRGLG
jgi:hypothetical protein